MRVQIDQDWRSYVRAGEETTAELLEDNPQILVVFDEFDVFFRERFWEESAGLSPQATLLALHSYMMLLGGLRMALTGHAAATYPLYRTALESACYAYLMATDDTYERAWINRHKNKDAARVCRAKFRAAVDDTASAVNKVQPGSGDVVTEAYQAAIDYGAHPNPRSIFPHMHGPEDIGQYWKVGLTGLHAAGAPEVSRSLVAALEYGLIVAIVLLRARKDPKQEIADAVSRLHRLKEGVVADMTGSMPKRS
jgi:hypothetical protein